MPVRWRHFIAASLMLLVAVDGHCASAVLLQVPFFPDRSDQCGPATLASLLSFWNRPATPSDLKKEIYVAKLRGTLPMDLLLTAEKHGLAADMRRGDLDLLRHELQAGRPVMAMVNLGFSFAPVDHYVIVTGFDESRQGFFMHTGGTRNQFVPYKKFLRQWEKTDYWTLTTRSSPT